MSGLLSFIWRRSLTALLTIVGAVALLFLLIHFVPGDLASILFGPRATPELRAALVERMGLDKPFIERLFIFLWGAARGDFGIDVVSGRPILDIVLEVLPKTLELAFAALGASLFFGIPLGAIAAVKPGSLIDMTLGVISVVLITTPGTPGDPIDQLVHLILPTTALALGWIGYIARLIRASLLEVLAEQHVRTLRAYGVPEWRIILIFAMRLALVPVVAILGIGLGDLIGSAIFAEIIFARPGIGTLIYNAVASRNYAVVQAGTVIVVLAYVLANVCVDIVNGLLDRRFSRAVK
jgi:peptide/nickel transport system permease protein